MANNTGGKFSGVPGEAALYNLLPKGWTLLSTIAMGIGFAVYAWFSIEANAGAIQQMLEDNKAQADATQGLHTEQQLMKQKFDLYIIDQERRDRAMADRDEAQRELLERILNDIRRPPAR